MYGMSKLFCGLLGASVVLGAGYFYLVAPRTGKRAPKRDAFHTSYAHRGLHGLGVPENSLAAFSADAQHIGRKYELKKVIEVKGRQGIAIDESYYYVSSTTAIYKYDKDGNLVAEGYQVISEEQDNGETWYTVVPE